MDWKARIAALVVWLVLALSLVENGNAEQRIVCYYTNWSVYRPGTAKFSPQNINPYLCTHLIYAFGGFTKDNTLKPFDKYQDIEKGGYAKFTGLKTYNKKLKTMLAIGGWNEGSSRFSPMVADPDRRKEFVKNSVKFLRQNHFDGLDLDWEYPAFRDGGKPRDRKNYADLVQELREEYERESSKTGRPRLLLSMAVPAGIEYIDKGYDIPRLNEHLDFINLLSYDYHSAFEPAVNHHSPIYPLEEDNEYNYDSELTIDYTIGHLLKSGASSEKIVLGIPTYGRSYTLINEDATDIGSPADGPGEEGEATREKGYLAYYEICESIGKSDEWEVVQPNPNAMGPYAYRDNQWVGYDDEDIVRAKSRYVIEKKLGGIMFWSIDNDDFRGKCHGRPYPLIEAAKEELLAGTESNTGQKTKDNRKKIGTRGNAINRKVGTGSRRTTTTESSSARRRANPSKTNARANARSRTRINANANDDEDDDEDEDASNAVKVADKPRTRIRGKNRSNNRSTVGGRRKQQQNSRENEDGEVDADNERSLSNSLTTPEPPTTPDPGSDFKCEDEGFYSHPRDCKKYFWCLDSGAAGLGVVAHQFTCPSGLVFNKAADSCDYPRNVVCPKKTSASVVTTTTAPTTSRKPDKTSKRVTTPEPDAEDEEYEYYEDEDADDVEESKEESRTTTTLKPLRYKTINRSRSTTTTSTPSTTTTETSVASSTRSYKTTTDRSASFEDEEDPRVLKELIDLIKKAGGIEQLEKQLHYQEKNSGGNVEKTESSGKSTPSTISRSLYERVLSRQATRIAGSLLGSLSTTQSTKGDKTDQKIAKNSPTGFVNGPGGAQFEGLDDISEVKSLRRTNSKPTYVTIERHRPSTSETPAEDDEDDEEDANDENIDVASLEDRAASDSPQQKNTNRRVTPSYFNIRRPRPSTTTTSENDVEVKDEDSNEDNDEDDEEPVTQRNRIVKTDEESAGPKSRYTNIHRFRSTTSRNKDVDKTDESTSTNDIKTEPQTTTTTTTSTKIIPVTEDISEVPVPSTTSSTIASTISESVINSKSDPSLSSSIESTTDSSPITPTEATLKLVDESATEILLTTASVSSSSMENTVESSTRGPIIAVVSQPRPFTRRGRPTTSTTTSPSSSNDQSRPKVIAERFGQSIAKKSVGPSNSSIVESSSTSVSSTTAHVDATIDDYTTTSEKIVDRAILKNRLKNVLRDNSDENDDRESVSSRDEEILDNDVLESEEIQHRSNSPIERSTDRNDRTNVTGKIVEVPVKILDDDDEEAVAELVVIRIPENRLNSAILKPTFRVKIVQSDRPEARGEEAKSDYGIKGHKASVENSLENELYEHVTRPWRKRRVGTNRTKESTKSAEKSDVRSDGKIQSRGRQRIVKARRRTVVKKSHPDESVGKNSTDRHDERFIEGQEVGKSGTTISATFTENPTTVRITTMRGNFSATTKSSDAPRGFYITKSSDEIVKTTSQPIVGDRLTVSTDFSSPSNDFVDLSTESTDFSTKSTDFPTKSTDFPTKSTDFPTKSTDFPTETTSIQESASKSQDEKIYGTTEDSLTRTTLEELKTTGTVAGEIDSAENTSTMTLNDFETVTFDSISTNKDVLQESLVSAIVTTTEGREAVEEASMTKFRRFGSGEPIGSQNNIFKDSTTSGYSMETNKTDPTSHYDVTNIDETTKHVTETQKTSEDKNDTPSVIFQGQTSIVKEEIDGNDNNASIATRSEDSTMKTMIVIDETMTTHGMMLGRGRVRFATTLRPVSRTETFSRDHPRRTTKESNLEGVDVKVEGPTSTIGSILGREGPELSFRSRSRRPTQSTQSIGPLDVTDSLVTEKSTKPSVTKVTTASKTTQQYKFVGESNGETTNFLGGENDSQTSTLSLEVNDDRLISATPMDLTTLIVMTTKPYENVELTTEIPRTTKSEIENVDDTKMTTKFLETVDSRIDSVTPMDLTTMNDASSEGHNVTTSSIDITDSMNPTTRLEDEEESSWDLGLLKETGNSLGSATTIVGINDNATTTVMSLPEVDALQEKEMEDRRHHGTGKFGESSTEIPEYDTTSVAASTMTTTSHSNPEDRDSTTTDSTTSNELFLTTSFSTGSHEKSTNATSSSSDNHEKLNRTDDVGVLSSTTLSTIDDDTTNGTKYSSIPENTISNDPASSLSQEESVPTILTNSHEIPETTNVPSTSKTPSWIPNRRKTIQKNLKNDYSDNFNDTTITIPILVTLKKTFVPEVKVPTYSTNQQQPISTDFYETTPTMDAKNYGNTDPTESLQFTTLDTILNREIERTTHENIVINDDKSFLSVAKVLLPKINHDFESSTINQNFDETIKSTTSSTINSSRSATTQRSKNRNRGRVTFTNFAGNFDDAGTRRRPVKQVIVRRRLANTSNNKNLQPNNSTNSQISHEIKNNNTIEKIVKKNFPESMENLAKPVRRRVVILRNKIPTDFVSTTTPQNFGLTSNVVNDDEVGKIRKRKWKKRLVMKRPKNDDVDDQSIAETNDFRRSVIGDSGEVELELKSDEIGSFVDVSVDRDNLYSTKSEDVDIGDGEVNIYKSSGNFLRRPGTLVRTDGSNRLRTVYGGPSLLNNQVTTGQPVPFSKIRSTDATEEITTDDQSVRAQELAVTLADPPIIRATGRQTFRATTRKISTTIAPRTEAPAILQTTAISRRRQRPRSDEKTVENVTVRPRRPAIIDYDYYVDDEVRLVVKPELKDKLFVNRKGGIRCLDQGNFAHPTSCKKFITCARMVNGQVLGTEYTCPDKLSFDPVGGICNWSAGLGCEDKSNP